MSTSMAERPTLSRPLSEISVNESRRRVSSTASNRSSMQFGKSRPTSEAKDEASSGQPSSASKRASTGMAPPLQTITLNLVEYARTQHTTPSSPSLAQTATPSLDNNFPPLTSTHSNADSAPLLPSHTTRAEPPELPKRSDSDRRASTSSTGSKGKQRADGGDKGVAEASGSGVSSFLQARRASLRPSSLSISYADVAKPVASPPPTTADAPQSSAASAFSSVDSLPSKSSATISRPAPKSKPSWLRRASGTAVLRTKSKTPPPREDGSFPASASMPPTLPPRRGLETMAEVPTSQSLPEDRMAPPPFPQRKTSYANVAAAGSSRSKLGNGQGRPAFSPSSSSPGIAQAPPPLPSRENVGNIRGRIAAWTAAAQSSGSFNRSESSNSLASQASMQQRFPASAQRVLGHAGSAVSKGWAGLRARGVGGSVSSMSALGQSSKRGPSSSSSFEPSSSWSAGLAGKSRDRHQSGNYDSGPGSTAGPSDGPAFEEGSMRRKATGSGGKVFGRDVGDSGKEWGVTELDGEYTEYERRRRRCLPAVVIRSVEYLAIWGPKEEGIFRISGRSSHIARLRKEFDSGADIDLTRCHPGDLDPHAVASLFKSYLRELPSPLLTHQLSSRFDAYIRNKPSNARRRSTISSLKAENGSANHEDGLKNLLSQLPQAHWFLLSDIVRLLDLIPRHSATNRMTQNALMLSLGPSLNIPGGILNELIEKRQTLFTDPPPPTTLETTADLINFGDVAIPPVSSPLETVHRSETPVSAATDDGHSMNTAASGSGKSKRASRLPTKPSLTKLFGSSMNVIPRQNSHDTISSIVTAEPPRVDLPLTDSTPLPTFEHDKSSNATTPKDDIAILADRNTQPITPLSSGVETLQEVQYPTGTVEERSRAFSTPIADRFQGTSSPFPPLRGPRSSNGSLSGRSVSTTVSDGNSLGVRGDSPNSKSTNPATVIRRGQPVFFQSAGPGKPLSHSRSTSLSASPLLSSPNLGSTPVAAGKRVSGASIASSAVGQKRKDEGETARNVSEGSLEDGRAKRLSAGPGTLGSATQIELGA
ncbi:hypothetical protein IAU60_000780 [Kwoniella sp. DSM 27419]